MSLELEDHAWFPAWMRRQQMEFISYMAAAYRLYQPLIVELQQLKQVYAFTLWTDLCTGASGPIQYLVKNGFETSHILLTDKFLMKTNWHSDNIKIEYQVADVLSDQLPGDGLVTMFNAFHHFSKNERFHILRNIAAQGRPFLIAEITQPNPISFLVITAATLTGQLLLAPFVQPFSLKRLVLTYLIPINLFTITWDGWVSVLKSVTKRSFQEMAAKISTPAYEVTFHQKGPWWKKVYILKGQPTL